jgi:hypothetical protein
MCFTVSRRNAAEMPVQRLKGGNPTSGLPSGRQVTRLGEFSVTFKPQRKDKKRENFKKY